MGKVVIVEGMDGTGKSTLILKLSQDLRVAHARSFGKPDSLKMTREWADWALNCPQPLVLDRHPAISELVYGPLLRGQWHSNYPLASAYRQSAFLIHCRPARGTMLNHLKDQPQMEGVEDRAISLYKIYDELMLSLCPDLVYDWEDSNYEFLKEKVRDYLTAA